MKIVIEIEVESLGDAARIVMAQRNVAQHARKIWASKRTQRELLEMFTSDFEAFAKFAWSANELATALRTIASIQLPDEGKPLSSRFSGKLKQGHCDNESEISIATR